MGRPKKAQKKTSTDAQCSFRSTPEVEQAIDDECARIKQERPGAVVHKSEAVRSLILRGARRTGSAGGSP